VSFDVFLLDPQTVPTVDEIYEVLESDGPDRPLSARLRAAIDECHARWPAYDDAGHEVDAPWASWPLARDAEPPAIEVNIMWDHAATMLPALIDVARRHEIVLYDPQQGQLHLPPRLR
jgi:hypothetical protein